MCFTEIVQNNAINANKCDIQVLSAREISKQLNTLPLHMWLTDEEFDMIIVKVNEFVSEIKMGLLSRYPFFTDRRASK